MCPAPRAFFTIRPTSQQTNKQTNEQTNKQAKKERNKQVELEEARTELDHVSNQSNFQEVLPTPESAVEGRGGSGEDTLQVARNFARHFSLSSPAPDCRSAGCIPAL